MRTESKQAMPDLELESAAGEVGVRKQRKDMMDRGEPNCSVRRKNIVRHGLGVLDQKLRCSRGRAWCICRASSVWR
jgi:hypothetical protein